MSNYLLKNRTPNSQITLALALAKSQKMMRPDTCATFTGVTNQCLEVPHNASIAVNKNEAIIIGGWIQPTGTFPPPNPQWGAYKFLSPNTPGSDYAFGLNNSGSSIVVRYQNSRKTLATGINAAAANSNATNTEADWNSWYFVTWTYDPRKTLDNIPQVYFGRRELPRVGWVIYDPALIEIATSTAPLRLGGTGGGGNNAGVLAQSANARLSSFFVCRPDPNQNIEALCASAFDEIYNGGFGRSYRSLSEKNKSDWGLVSWWNLDTITGNLFKDSHGTNHAANVGGVTLS